MSERSILRVQYTPVTPRVVRRVGGFLNYIRERDVHVGKARGVEGLVRYVANRDRSALRGLLFGPEGPASEADSQRLVAYVKRSTHDWKPQLYRDASGNQVDSRRAVSRFVLSPERAEGLDLQQVTRAMLHQLELDADGLPPWIAAEHRNTEHRHVHLVLASRRELAPGRYRTVKITRERLARMKQAMMGEIERQRELERWRQQAPLRTRGRGWLAELEREAGTVAPAEWAVARRARMLYAREPGRPLARATVQRAALRPAVASSRESAQAARHFAHRSPVAHSSHSAVAGRLRQLADRYRREAEREAERWRREQELERAR